MITLRRFYLPFGTYGQWEAPDLPMLHTCERPWLGNQPFVSCIPEGRYVLKKGVFHRNTEDPEDDYPCLVVQNVPGRTLIKVHRLNFPDESQGCIGVGKGLKARRDCYGIADSKVAHDELMEWWAALEWCDLEIVKG